MDSHQQILGGAGAGNRGTGVSPVISLPESFQLRTHGQDAHATRGGFTLLEVIISTAVVGILVVGFLQLLLSQSQIRTEELSETTVEGNVRAAMENLVSELQEAKYAGLTFAGVKNYDYGDAFIYSIPMKDISGRAVLDANGAMQFGMGYPGAFTVGATATIRFLAGTRAEDTILESSLKQDINGDGDQLDTFNVGTLEQTHSHNAAFVRLFGGQLVREASVGAKIFNKYGENFQDTNLNGLYDNLESYQDANGNGIFDLGLNFQVMFLDPDNKNSRIKLTTTTIRLRNVY